MGKALNDMMPSGFNVYISSVEEKRTYKQKLKDEKRQKKLFKMIKKMIKSSLNT